MYPLFETIRIVEGEPRHLEWHQERLDVSWHRYYKRYPTLKLEEVVKVPDRFSKGTVKCRVLYNRDHVELQFEPYRPRKLQNLKLVNGDNLEYSMKYTERDSLDRLLHQRGDCDDILIGKNGRITDTSYTNIVLFDGDRWYTPLIPLLEGTCRNRLVAEKRILEADILVDELDRYSGFRLINAMLDFDDQPILPIGNIRR